MNETKLTVLIPTRKRPHILKETIALLVSEVTNYNLHHRVEIICVDNFSEDETSEVVNQFIKKFSFVKYQKQVVLCESAETSLFNAIKFANYDYIWCFGDDDIPGIGSIAYLLNIIDDQKPSFILLNTLIKLPATSKTFPYLEVDIEPIYFKNTKDLFKQFGLVTATTTISCLVLKKSNFNINIALKLAGISQVYSHSSAILISYHNLPAVFIRIPLLTYRQNLADDEEKRFSNFCKEKGIIPESLFTSGLIGLIKIISSHTQISFKEFSMFTEHELRKDNWILTQNKLYLFVLRFSFNRFWSIISNDQKICLSDLVIIREVFIFLLRGTKLNATISYLKAVTTLIITKNILLIYNSKRIKRLTKRYLDRCLRKLQA